MNRILLFLFALPVVFVYSRPVSAANEAPPNFVLVMCDDLGWGDPGFNGNNTIQTPHLDAMAAGGLKFSRFYAAAPVCSPTRGSVLTGRHPFRYGVVGANRGHLKSDELTLAERLRERGYTTGHFGKWHLGTLTKTVRDSNRGGPRGVAHFSPPQENGFDICFSTEAKVPTYDPMLKPAEDSPRTGWTFLSDRSAGVPYGTHYWNERGAVVTDNLEGDDSRVIMDRVVPFLRSAVNRGKPFFAVIWFHTPHLPVVAGPRHARLYPDVDEYRRNYYGCITAMDEQIGRLRSTLRMLNVAENTLVAFCSDNGPEGKRDAPGSAGPFRGRKRDLYEGGIRVPGLMEWPAKIAAGSKTDYPAVTSDYLPTILEIIGDKLPDDRALDGVSLLPVIAQNLTERPQPIGFEHRGKVAWIDNRYKLISNDPRKEGRQAGRTREASTFQLFDLLKDPGESHDLAKSYPMIVEKMRDELETWRASCRRDSQQ